jgi:hypothetical protein
MPQQLRNWNMTLRWNLGLVIVGFTKESGMVPFCTKTI